MAAQTSYFLKEDKAIRERVTNDAPMQSAVYQLQQHKIMPQLRCGEQASRDGS